MKKTIRRGIVLLLTIILSITALPLTGRAAGTERMNATATQDGCGYEQPRRIPQEDIPVFLSEADEEEIASGTEKFYTRSVNGDAAYWGQYASDYYYQQLNEEMRTVYTNMYNMCMTYLTTTQDAWTGGSYGFTGYIASGTLSVDEVDDLWVIFMNSNPQFYFLDNYYPIYSGNRIQLSIYPAFVSGSSREAATNQMKAVIDRYMTLIKAEGSTYAQQKKANDLVCDKVNYAESTYDQSCASVFLDNQSVCAGYAEAYELLCNGAGIPTITVTSYDHEWAKSKVGDYWYVVDVTWNDTDQGYVNYWFFDISDASAVRKDGGGHHNQESWWTPYNVPHALYDYTNTPAGGTQDTTPTPTPTPTADRQLMYRLYNPNSGEHFYTANTGERNNLIWLGWNDEGIGWTAPVSGNAVYRMYNPNAGDHHYTMNANERDVLIRAGWTYEGIGWYSDVNQSVPLYRAYNPNAQAGSHNYTTNAAENNMLCSVGWSNEGIAWYGIN